MAKQDSEQQMEEQTELEGAVDAVDQGDAGAETVADEEKQSKEDSRRADAGAADRDDSVETLEEEGEFAADYLEELLDIADIGGDIDMDVENGRASVAIIGEGADKMDLQRLVGRDGQVLEALQELTRLAVQQKTGQRSRLMLDIGDYRADRKRELTAIAEEAITKVKATGEPVKLDAMNPFERKVCHDVAATAGCFSESDGQSPYRHVIISIPEDDTDDDDE